MQKKLIALAVAGLVSGGAFAQSNVSIYGIVDAGFANQKYDGADKSVNKIDSGLLSTSRLGFKGEEALGNGLKAVFNLEYALYIDQNNTIGTTDAGKTMKARKQYVGLSSDTYGTVLAGYLTSAGYDFAEATSPLAASQLGASKVLSFNDANGFNKGLVNVDGRLQNAVSYVSPTFAGFNVVANHGRITESANTNYVNGIDATKGVQADAYANALGLNYANGPLTAGLVYAKQSLQEKGVGATYKSDVEEYGIRGGYDFGVAKLQAAYQTFENKDLDKNKANGGRDSKWVIGATVPVSAAGKIIGEYASLNVKNDTTSYADAKAWTLAYTHALSKRTTAYAGYNQVSSDITNKADKGDVRTFGFGVRHSF